MMLLFLSWFLTCNGTKWPKLCLCAVKKLLTHSLMSLGNPADSEGWEEIDGVLRTVFTRKPSVPKSCLELVTCKCENNQCRTGACKCVRSGHICLPACGCAEMGCLSIFSVADS